MLEPTSTNKVHARMSAPPCAQTTALHLLLSPRFEGFCCVSDVPEEQTKKTSVETNDSPSKIKAWNSLRRCGLGDSTHISQLNQGYWTLASTMSLRGRTRMQPVRRSSPRPAGTLLANRGSGNIREFTGHYPAEIAFFILFFLRNA